MRERLNTNSLLGLDAVASACGWGCCSVAVAAVASTCAAAFLLLRFLGLAVVVALAVAAVVVAVAFISLNFRGFVTCPEGLIEFLRCNIRERSGSDEQKFQGKFQPCAGEKKRSCNGVKRAFY